MRRCRALSSILAWVPFFALGCVHSVESRAETASCPQPSDIAVLSSPIQPWKGAPLKVVFATDQPLDGELSLLSPNGSVAVSTHERRGGPPYFWLAEMATPAVGTWRAKLTLKSASSECAPASREIKVRGGRPGGPGGVAGSVWPVRDNWDRANENLYSAWIERLFEAPLDEAPSWTALHEVLRDPNRNILFNHLGLREDQKGLVIRPDCADLPYFLRGYFAFKMGLPFGYSKCSRGGGGKAPRCGSWWNIKKEETANSPDDDEKAASSGGLFDLFSTGSSKSKKQSKPRQGLVQSFGTYLRSTVANSVHSGSGRTSADDNNTDYYPVPLTQEALRPGTIYADPYGHVLVLAKRVAQTPDGAGVFLAVDGQPDGTVARKRFWRGNFLFAQNPAMGSPGFKRFRPIVQVKGGELRRLSNAEIAKSADYGDFSIDQSKLSVEDFYDKMDDVMSPQPLDPARALNEAVASLEEQVKARVTSVENGRKYHAGGGKEVGMPEGASIFETTGAWEDFATPSRDLRLLIAIDVVRGFPDRVARRPERYAMPKDKSAADVKAQLESVLANELAARKFTYTRTDGSEWSLTLKDVVDRMHALEMAYNINDCVELRWGADEKSDEATTCKRRAPQGQRSKMAQYRDWFHERRRPPRG